MKKFLIVFLVFFVACSNGSEESSEAIETIETTTTIQETTTTTSSTTTTMVEEEYEVDPPKVLITNCPTEDINADIYELEWTAEAGSGDIVYIGIFVEKDDANFTRVFFTKEDNADLITFPTAYTSNSYSYQIDNTDSNVAASYIIEINIISEQPNGDQVSTYDLCFTNYSPPTTTTSTTTTSTTTTSTTTTTTVPPFAETYIGLDEDGNPQGARIVEFKVNYDSISRQNVFVKDLFFIHYIPGTYVLTSFGIDFKDVIYENDPDNMYGCQIDLSLFDTSKEFKGNVGCDINYKHWNPYFDLRNAPAKKYILYSVNFFQEFIDEFGKLQEIINAYQLRAQKNQYTNSCYIPFTNLVCNKLGGQSFESDKKYFTFEYLTLND